ncbi:hypothetical protein GCM10009851_26090 [Herbiconiux moechotypicola]|uniref:Peptidase S8/S53 domain-containing protein n=2 Tax=Herbiconiux moechotypicola TaxID=637393 RepID=A0ABN3DRA8_9MICO
MPRVTTRGVRAITAGAALCALLTLGAGISTATARPSGGEDAPVLTQGLSLLAAEASGTAAPSSAIDPQLGLRFDDSGRVAVEAVFSDAASRDAATDAAAQLGEIRTLTLSQPTIVLAVDPEQLDALAALPGIISVQPIGGGRVAGSGLAGVTASGITDATASGISGDPSCNPLDVEADAPAALDSAAARAAFGVDGTGVTVGIISDSFHALANPYRTWADDVAAGALPGSTNPCGYLTDVVVYEDGAAPYTGTTDEGRAMAQLVHGVAPGAKLVFATGGASQAEYADNIRALQSLGADVIVDDLVIFDEPNYQEGIIGAAIREVTAEGTLYLSAAQNQTSFGQPSTAEHTRYNEGQIISSWATDAYRPMACPDAVTTLAREAAQDDTLQVDCQDFGAAGSPNPLLQAELSVATPAATVTAHWAEPVWGVETSMLLLTFEQDGTTAVEQNPTNEFPANAFSRNEFVPLDAAPESSTYQFALVRILGTATTPGTPGVKIQFELDDNGVFSLGDGSPWGPGVTVGPSISGHPGDETVLTLGAASVLSPDRIEAFSGVGPVEYLFEPATATQSTPVVIPDPVERAKPDVTSVDGSLTTFFPNGAAGSFRFYGTSAATPNAGAVAALALEHAPGTTPAELRDALLGTATAMPAQAGDWGVSTPYITGTGRIDALAALQALTPEPAPTPAPTPSPSPGPALAATGSGSTGASLGVAVPVAVLLLAAGSTALVLRGRRRATHLTDRGELGR